MVSQNRKFVDGKKIKKIKVLMPSDRSFKEMDDFCQGGGEAFSVSRYGYEILKNSSTLDIDVMECNDQHPVIKFLKPFLGHEANNLVSQLKIISSSSDYDIIYYSSDRHPYLISMAKFFGLCQTPVLMLCHFSFNTQLTDKFFKKIVLRVERWMVFKSIESILFLCDSVMRLAMNDFRVPSRHLKNSHWGASLEYFSRTSDNSIDVPDEFYFSSGGAVRDYKTLIDAFRELDLTLVISCPMEVVHENHPLPKNVIHYDFAANGMHSFSDIRSLNQRAKAILIPIKETNHVPNASSTFVEALACGKPILISDTGNTFLDVEAEEIGLKVKMLDVNDWIRKIFFFEKNPNTLESMSENAFKAAKTYCNYELFATVVEQNIRTLSERRFSNKN